MRLSATLLALFGATTTTLAIPLQASSSQYSSYSQSNTSPALGKRAPSEPSTSTPDIDSIIDISTAISALLSPFDPKWKVSSTGIRTAKPSLPQHLTNGKSRLGTFDASTFMQYKGQLGDSTTFPWGNRTAHTNYYKDVPDTGVVQKYEWTIERAFMAPDGVNKSMIVVNGGFPGPTIEANWGDTIQVTVHNKITGPEEGTAIHWHGLIQRDTPWEDGVPGVTQCPIPPGESFTYSFKADLYGTSWWHAHYSAQYAAGAIGPMIIHGPVQDEATYDEDLGPVLLTDYYHRDYFSLVQDVMGTDLKKIAPKSDNNLINGKGVVNCSLISSGAQQQCTPNAGLARFNVTSGSTYRLRLVNAGVEGIQKFSIDDHDLTVIAYDFVPIVPYTTKIITLGVGQRADVLVKATKNPNGIYWIRSRMTKCALTNQPNALALLYYESSNKDSVPAANSTIPQIDNTDPCANDDLSTLVPYFPLTPSPAPARTQTVNINFTTNATGSLVWTMDGSTFRTNYNRPMLFDLINGTNSSTFPREWNAYDFGSSSSVRIILNNYSPIAHPMHIHGHNMFVLSSSSTISPNPIIPNTVNPARRDVQQLVPNGQIVIQVELDNPGAWPLHCHIAWHVSAGLYMNIVERTQEITKLSVPDRHRDLCRKWDAFTTRALPNMIDSGLKFREKERLRVRE